MTVLRKSLALVLLLVPAAAHAADGGNAVTAGRLIVERPTLVSLGFEWMVSGDANRNASVKVEYRKAGSAAWLLALPMMRLKDSPSSDNGSNNQLAPYHVPNAFAGSVFHVEPGMKYEARFTLSDPDGAHGKFVQMATVTTRSEPMPAPGGHVYHVYPPEYKGAKQQPAFNSLNSAYYMGQRNADHYDGFEPRVQPGDTILVHAGLYKDDHKFYGLFINHGGALGVPFDGTYYLVQSGTPDKPIVIKGAGDGEVIFDGAGAAVLFDVTAANYNYFEGITVRNAEVGFLVGRKRIVGASGFTLKHSKIEDVGRGVHDDWGGSKDFYIADNVFVGRHDTKILMSWDTDSPWEHLPGFPAPISGPGGSEYAVKIYGQGHVIAYNKVTGFHDGIDHATFGAPTGSPDHVVEENLPSSDDVYGNDVNNEDDNCFEADGSARNYRIFDNRCFNSRNAISMAPTFGGPIYLVRNLIYNSVMNTVVGTGGLIAYQNTIQGDIHDQAGMPNLFFRNNLILAENAYPSVFGIQTDETSSSDYNGFMARPGGDSNFYWVSDPKLETDHGRHDDGPDKVKGFATLADYARATGQDTHSIAVSFDDFVKASGTDRGKVTIAYQPEDYDFRLKPDSKAVDAGMVLPNITDGFTGKAPDLGVYEIGQPLPHYGPRD